MFSIIVSIPIFDYSTYWTTTDSYQTGLNILEEMHKKDPVLFTAILNSFEVYHKNVHGMVLGTITHKNDEILEANDPNVYRTEELLYYQSENGDQNHYLIVIDYYDNNLNSILGIIRTCFVITVLVTGVVFFTKDANDYVVVPIENMLSKVKRIAENPLEAAKIEEDEQII